MKASLNRFKSRPELCKVLGVRNFPCKVLSELLFLIIARGVHTLSHCLVIDGLHVNCLDLVQLLLLVGHWVHDIEYDVLLSIKEQAPEVALARASMKNHNFLKD